MNLFTIKNRFAIHLATNSIIIALSESWFEFERIKNIVEWLKK